MNTLANSALAKAVSFTDDSMVISFMDGRELSIPLAYFPRLLNASHSQRQKFAISGGGTGLHWDEIDEDISIANLLLGFGDTTKQSSFLKKEEAA